MPANISAFTWFYVLCLKAVCVRSRDAGVQREQREDLQPEPREISSGGKALHLCV